jgi:hypothetical protein
VVWGQPFLKQVRVVQVFLGNMSILPEGGDEFSVKDEGLSHWIN